MASADVPEPADGLLRRAFVGLEVNAEFTEAVLTLADDSRLCFRHRVGERWAKAVAPGPASGDPGTAGLVLSRLALFRLNARHLEIRFADGSRWELRFRG